MDTTVQLNLNLTIAKRLLRAAALAAIAMFVLFGLGRDTAFAQGVPNVIAHQGRLLNAANVPITSATSVNFAIYDAATAGTQAWNETTGRATAYATRTR